MESSAKFEGKLADIEVRDLLKMREIELESSGTNDPNRPLERARVKNRDYIVDKTLKYMKDSTLPDDATEEMVTNCFALLKKRGFELTEAELISIANQVPTEECEIAALIPPTFESGEFQDLKRIICESFNIPEMEALQNDSRASE